MHFNKLVLTGFKSFVDRTELLIEPGLTGVVGPNGCGKSNLVEALRWVMGETSPKQMRGGEMDDVIFSGTDRRPSRNKAAVALHLDNSDNTAPAPFNEQGELEIQREIERGEGSNYTVNGQHIRARDVQTLFADLASGARSTAMVSQGRVGAIINAKPAQRRAVIDEAAGIGGLYARRHEAELRLNAAETNLARLEDVLVTLHEQLKSLKRQARQATRYRNLSDHIRKAEAAVLAVRLETAETTLAAAQEDLAKSETLVQERTTAASRAATEQADAAGAVPPLRDAEAKAAAEHQRLIIAREQLDNEAARLENEIAAARARRDQIVADLEREGSLIGDAEQALERLGAETQRLEADGEGEAARREAAEQALAESENELRAAETSLDAILSEIAAEEARQSGARRTLAELGERRGRLERRMNEQREQLAALEHELEGAGSRDQLAAELEAARCRLQEARERAETASEARRARQGEAQEAAEAAGTAAARLAELKAEEAALNDLLVQAAGEGFSPVMDVLEVSTGYEAALGAALGDDLTAATDAQAPLHWRQLDRHGAAPSLPAGAQPLSQFVRAPGALGPRLSQIGVVADAETGQRLQGALAQGQRLVTRDGGLWRWDGFAMAAGTETAAANRLKHRARLETLREERATAERTAEQAAARAGQAREAQTQADSEEQEARRALQQADQAVHELRDRHDDLARRHAAAAERREGLNATIAGLAGDLEELGTQIAEAERLLAEAPDLAGRRSEAETARGTVQTRRAAVLERTAERDRIRREAENRAARLQAIAEERDAWQRRIDGARAQQEKLKERRDGLAGELTALEARPGEIEAKRGQLFSAIEDSAGKRNAAGDALAEAEQRLNAADQALRAAESAAGEAREARVAARARVEQAQQNRTTIVERIAERVEARPEELRELAGIAEDAALPPLEDSERKLERLQRERDNMGPVNLRAEAEAEEIEAQIAAMESERDDLVSAIARLRQGIGALNREGRQRFLAAFEEVNTHFQELFVRLFGGGRAQLMLTEADDPLEAGLDIVASPPGKKLQSLSLLSGGEQALTATALLFAVFMTNPAPICVLDEVDAPLDDANVERFCNLLHEIARDGRTRFMIITHHRITMARMDRLFGVTMAERGVSQLVSVDLRQAERFREAS